MGDLQFTAQIQEGLFDPSPRESVFRVKNAVSKELFELDPTACIHQTDYFNHTFAPDFVLTWPDQAERHVFLRLSHNLVAVTDDLSLIDRKNPLVIGLTPPSLDDPDLDLLTEATSSAEAMFTDPDALESLIQTKKGRPAINLLNNALAQGGRGLLTQERAKTLSDIVEKGFSGAVEADFSPTLDAVNALTDSLYAPQAWRINRVLQAIWEGSAAPTDLFPGDPDLSGQLNVEALQYLISYMDTDDLSFWRRVGRNLTVPQISRLNGRTNSQNINRLVQANLDVIKARACSVIEDPFGIASVSDSHEPTWTVRDERLLFSGADFHVLVGETKADLLSKEPSREDYGISVNYFVERAHETNLNEVTMRDGRDVITAKNEDGELDSDHLLGLASQLGPSAEVTEAVAQSSSGRVTANFLNLTGTGQTRSNILLADLLTTALPLLHSFDAEGLHAFRKALAFEKVTTQDVALFDFDSRHPDDSGAK